MDEAINILALSYNVCECTKVMAVILCVSKLKGASGLSTTIIVTIIVMLYEYTQTSLYNMYVGVLHSKIILSKSTQLQSCMYKILWPCIHVACAIVNIVNY